MLDVALVLRDRFEMLAEHLEHAPWIAGDLELREVRILGKSLETNISRQFLLSHGLWLAR